MKTLFGALARGLGWGLGATLGVLAGAGLGVTALAFIGHRDRDAVSVMKRLYYIGQWTDESMPCQPTLEGWAEWLSKPDEDWQRSAPAQHGEQFTATVTLELADIRIYVFDGAWQSDFSPAPGANWFALRWGPGLGCDAEVSHDSFADLLAELDLEDEGDEAFVGQFQHLNGGVMLEYQITQEGPRLIELAPVS